MLSILQQPGRNALCDGISRRDFIKIGGLGMGRLTLAQLLSAEAHAGIRKAQKAVIMIYMVGGPPHQDMYDIKPDAPAEIAGPWKAIDTRVPGIRICEHLPRLAKQAKHLSVLRSITSREADHDRAIYFLHTGNVREETVDYPALGAVVARAIGRETVTSGRSSVRWRCGRRRRR